MSSSRSVRRIFLLCCAMWASSACLAQVATARASLTDFGITVIDLAPGDGIVAGSSMLSAWTDWRVPTASDDPYDAEQVFLPVFLGDRSLAYTDANKHGAVRTTANSISSDASVTGPDTQGFGGAFGEVQLLLTPHSSIRFDGTFAAGLNCSSPCTLGLARTRAALWVYAAGTGYPPLHSAESSIYLDGPGNSVNDASKPIELSYSNESDAAVRVVLFVDVGSNVRTIPTSIPEPATAVLWLLGLGALGVARRTRGLLGR